MIVLLIIIQTFVFRLEGSQPQFQSMGAMQAGVVQTNRITSQQTTNITFILNGWGLAIRDLNADGWPNQGVARATNCLCLQPDWLEKRIQHSPTMNPTETEAINKPLQHIGEWEEFVVQHYPEPNGPAATSEPRKPAVGHAPDKKETEFRNYEADWTRFRCHGGTMSIFTTSAATICPRRVWPCCAGIGFTDQRLTAHGGMVVWSHFLQHHLPGGEARLRPRCGRGARHRGYSKPI